MTRTAKFLTLSFFLAVFFSAIEPAGAYLETKTGKIDLYNEKLVSSILKGEEGPEQSVREEKYIGTTWKGFYTFTQRLGKYEDCSVFCKNANNYTYSFNYEKKKAGSDNAWSGIEAKNSLFKCDDLKISFSAIGDWGSTFDKVCIEAEHARITSPKVYHHGYTPPTDIIECSGQDNCLEKAKEHVLNPDTFGKGVQQVPANFISGVEKSLNVDNTAAVCKDGSCFVNKEGKYTFSVAVPQTSYYGQCRGYGFTAIPEKKDIPAIASSFSTDVVNRAPTTTISFSNKNSKINEEVDVYCDAFDPDDCVDKISKVTLSCQDSKGDTSGCLIYDPSVGTLGNSLVREVTSDKQTNPFRLAAKFKVTKPGSYMVICNAMDNNGTSSTYPNGTDDGSGIGVNGVTVKEDGTTVNGGVIDSSMNFCALVADKGTGSPVCDSKSDIKLSAEAMYNLNPVKYQWKCGDGENEAWKDTTDGKYACSYSQAGTFVPSLRVVSKDGKTTDCKLQNKIKITAEKSCRVEARKANTTEEFSDKVIIRSGDSIETRVKQECLGKLPITWSVAGGSIEGTKDGLTTVKFGAAGEKSIGAKMTNTVKYTEEVVEKDEFGNNLKDSKGNDIIKKVEKERKEVTDCAGATIDVKDLNNWGAN